MELIEFVAGLAERDPIASMIVVYLVVSWWRARDEERGDKNLSSAIALTTTIVTTFEPVKNTLDNQAKITGDLVGVVERLVQRGDDMHAVVERRDKEAVQDRGTRDAQHNVIVTQLDSQQKAIDEITKHITVGTDENTLRHDIAKIVLLSDEIVRLVRALAPASEAGEPKPTEPEKADEPKETNHEHPQSIQE